MPKLNGLCVFVNSSRALKIVLFFATERSYQSVKFLNGVPSSFSAIDCVRDIWASRSNTSDDRLGDCAATCPNAHVHVVFPTPPLKLMVAIVFIISYSPESANTG